MSALFDQVRPTTWRVLTLAIVVCAFVSVLINWVVGPVGSPVREALSVVERATCGLVQVPLIAGPFYLAILGSVIFGIGRLSCSDVGLRRRDVVTGLLATAGFWVAMQPGLVIWVVSHSASPQWNEA